jgi:hypothetical protein
MCKREVIGEIACANRFGLLRLPGDRIFDEDLLKSVNKEQNALVEFSDVLFVFEGLLEEFIERDEADRGRC